VPDWDVVLTEQAALCPSPRPVLTTYAPAYTPGEPLSASSAPMRIDFDQFTADGIAMLRPGRIEGWQQRTRPYRGRFASGHFFFAPGRFVSDVPWDPDLYFTGDEITLAVRAFTHGYDLFVPSRLVLWHAYSKGKSRPKHWDDHGEDGAAPWQSSEVTSRDKITRLLSEPWVGTFGLGSERTLAEYEDYAGISFRHRRVQRYTQLHRDPPNPPAAPNWAEQELDRSADGLPDTEATGMSRLMDLWLETVRDELSDLVIERHVAPETSA
jgi:Glycosyltransferase (GlcNAc)